MAQADARWRADDLERRLVERLKELAPDLTGERACACGSAAQNAVVTDSKKIPDKLKEELSILFGK